MKKMKRILFIMLILSLICAVGTAGASTVQLKFDSVVPPTGVNIHADGLGDVNTQAGNYVVEIQGIGQLYGYCVDPSYANSNWSEYNLLAISNADPKYLAAAYILNKGYAGIQATEAQVAVWELVWDWGPTPDLTSGNFILNSGLTAAEVTAVGNIITDALANYASFDASGYRLAVSPSSGPFFGVNYQDFVVRAVPEPLTLLLVGSGLIPFIRLRKKRSS
jgi:hypothetical protein